MTRLHRAGWTIALLIALSGAPPVLAEDDSEGTRPSHVPELRAYHINPHPPDIDGDLSDAIWHSDHIEKSTSFTQLEPDDGGAPTESTMVAVAYDESAMYVAFWCYDSEPDKVARQLVRRDRDAEADNVTVCFDAFHDHQTANRFQVSAAGVQTDTRYYNDDWSDRSWDAVWESAVKTQPWGWSAEMRIPYHALRFAEQDEHTWGAQFTRYINRKDEYVKWAYSPQSEGGFVSRFGHLTAIQGVRPARQFQVLPYVVSRADREPRSVGNPDGKDFARNAGFDLKYGISSNLVLDATINPDFGQVELDAPVLNLSSYETFFPERRPFFLEGSDLYQSQFNLFYSRRVGRAPRGDVHDEDLAFYTDFPEAATILGAAKVTGKLTGGTAIAVLGAVTDRERARYGAETNRVYDSTWIGDSLVTKLLSADTVFREGTVEANGYYTVMSIKQDVFSNSHVGGIMTLAAQPGSHGAVTGGVDWRLRTANNTWGTDGQVVMSRTGASHTGFGLDWSLRKNSGYHTRGAVGVHIRDPYLDLNDLGFLSRSNMRHVWGWMQYRTTDDWWAIRNSYNNINFWSSWNYDGVNYELGGNFNTYVEFTNYWSASAGIGVQAEKYSDRETRGNGLWQWPVYPTVSPWLSINTDSRKKVSFTINPNGGSDRGGWWWSNYVGMRYRPRGNMEFVTGVRYQQNINAVRWVDNVDDRPLFADLDQDRISLSASASMLFNRNLSLQLSAEGLISALDYDNYKYYEGGNDYSESMPGFNYDRNFSTLNSTLLLRWEYRPGSTIYVVWTRSRPENESEVNNLALGRDLQRLFSGNDYNTFLVKMSYWLNM